VILQKNVIDEYQEERGGRETFAILYLTLSLSNNNTHKHSLFLYPRRVMITNGSNGVNSAYL
jgi:hypothetical protein